MALEKEEIEMLTPFGRLLCRFAPSFVVFPWVGLWNHSREVFQGTDRVREWQFGCVRPAGNGLG